VRLVSLKYSAVVLLAARMAVAAESQSATGVEVAFRTGVVFPAGNSVTYQALSNDVGLQFPMVVEVGYRIDEHLFLGVTGQYAFGTNGSGVCASGERCLANGARVGAEIQVHPRGRAALDPWIGLGFGYEWLLSRNTSISGTTSLGGFDFLSVDVGLDFAFGKIRVGPFAGFTMGQFERASGPDDDGNSSTYSIEANALHYWFCVGLKFTLLP
jgi:outer membrane protein W